MKHASWCAWLALAILSIAGCPSLPLTDPLPLNEVKFWAYQLQGIDAAGAVDALVDSGYDLLVLEPTRTDTSSEETAQFDTAAMVRKLKDSPGNDGTHRKRVLAYVNVGEAEDWRWYWSWSKDWPSGEPRPADWPSFILESDPDGWSGNYPVAYWDAAWKNILLYGVTSSGQSYNSTLDEVIQDDFDGVYLDWVEGFENDAVFAAAQAAGKNPAVEMIALIQEIRGYARQRGKTDFIVIQQNAANLIEGHPELTDTIDGIAQEGIWFDGEPADSWNDPDSYDEATDPLLTEYYLEYLKRYQDAGLVVFNCEYARYHASEAYSKSASHGFAAYVSRTSLARLTTTPPPEY